MALGNKQGQDTTERIVVNQSRVKSWRTCKRQHWYKYEEKLKRRRIKRPYMFGNIVHAMLEAYANGDDPFRVLTKVERELRRFFQAEKELYGDILQDVEYIMSEYFDYWEEHKHRLDYIELKGKYAEHVFEIEMQPGVFWKGKIDAFAESKGMNWLVEHKTFNREWDEDERWRNVQSVSYIVAEERAGWNINCEGTVWDYIMSKPPTRPKLKKDGTLSVRSIVTLPVVIEDFMKEHKLTNKKLWQDAHECRPKYFKRVFTPMLTFTRDSILSDFLESFDEIAQEHDKHKTRNIGRWCSWCEFEPLCRAAMTEGPDAEQYIKEKEYAVEEEDPAEKLAGEERPE